MTFNEFLEKFNNTYLQNAGAVITGAYLENDCSETASVIHSHFVHFGVKVKQSGSFSLKDEEQPQFIDLLEVNDNVVNLLMLNTQEPTLKIGRAVIPREIYDEMVAAYFN